MTLKFKRIAALSRDPGFLLRTVLWILLPGMAVAFAIGQWRSTENDAGSLRDPMGHWREAQPEVSSRSDCVRLLEDVRISRRLMLEHFQITRSGNDTAPKSMSFPEFGAASRFLSPQEQALLPDYAAKMMPVFRIDAKDLAAFAAAAAVDPPSGFIASMHGDLLRLTGKNDEALAAYERGAVDSETGVDCRRRALDLCLSRNWKEKLQRLYRQPGWREAVVDAGDVVESDVRKITAVAGDWAGLMKISWMDLRHSLRHPQWVLVSSLCGVLWFLVIHMGACIPVRLWWRGLAGFACGVLSIPLTLFFITAQETWFDFHSEDGGTGNIFYCISGIGLREELAKLILFLPLLLILRKATPAQVLAVAASVGLGFAIEENINYFAGNPEVWGRFLTANFLHFGLTGLTGLALWQAVRQPAKWLQHFTGVLVAAVVFHGLWDWHPADPRFAGDYVYFMLVLLSLLALYFFRELLRYSQPVPGVPSALFVFLAGGAVLLSVLMSILSWDTGFRLALVNSLEPVLDLFAIGAAMYYQLRRA